MVLKACNVLTQHLIPAAKHSEFLLHTNDLLFSGTVGHVLFSGSGRCADNRANCVSRQVEGVDSKKWFTQ